VAAYRLRARGAGLLAGAIALAGLPVVRSDAEELWEGLTSGAGLGAVLGSIAAGVATLALVWVRRFEPARATAAVAVAAIIAGWGFAQSPTFLPGLTVEEAAAERATLVALLVSVAIGALLLVPALALLFGMTLRGRFDVSPTEPPAEPVALEAPQVGGVPALGKVAIGCLAVGGGLLFVFDSAWPNVIGAFFLLAFVGTGFVALTRLVATAGVDER
jgi:cytochrome d ubiquinol oxidase subunit II